MLTKVTAFSQWAKIDPLVMTIFNPPDSEFLEIRNIDGLGPVKAAVNTTPKAKRGTTFTGTSVGERNLVFTIGLRPDWDTWTPSKLRRFLDNYFMPEQTIRFEFEGDEYAPVEISGYVESNEPNIFSKDPEHQISIICPDLYFKSIDPVIIEGLSTDPPVDVDYQGNVETGFIFRLEWVSGAVPNYALVQTDEGGTDSIFIQVDSDGPTVIVDNTKDLLISSIPGNKYVKAVIPATTQELDNLLNLATIMTKWPVIGPGTEQLFVDSPDGVQNWSLTYHDLYGSL